MEGVSRGWSVEQVEGSVGVLLFSLNVDLFARILLKLEETLGRRSFDIRNQFLDDRWKIEENLAAVA